MAKKETLFFPEENPKFEYADAAILGIEFDENASYGRGAAKAPKEIIRASHQMDIENPLTGATLETAIHYFGTIQPKSAKEMIMQIGAYAEKSLQSKKLFLLLGGDHSIVNGILEAVPKGTTFVNFDAHLDLREEWQGKKLSHAAVSRRIREKGFPQVWIGVRDSINEEEMGYVSEKGLGEKIFYCPTMPQEAYKMHPFPQWMDKKNMLFKKKLDATTKKAMLKKIETDKVWLNIDIDCLDPREGTETGVPTPFGLTMETLNELLFEICQNKQVIGMSLAELIPDEYGRGQAIAARLCYNILLWA